MSRVRFGLLFAIAVFAAAAAAQVPPASSVIVQATAKVTYNADHGLYTYTYSFRNDTSSLLEVDLLLLPLHGSSVLNIVAPPGWTGMVFRDGSTVSYMATDVPDPGPGFVDTGQLLPSPFQIKPGNGLSGFSFQSPDPPDFIPFYAQGFRQLPELGVDAPDPEDDVPPPSPFAQSFQGTTKGPLFSETLFAGGRRPAVDGFLVFQNLTNRDTKPAPVEVRIIFGVNGESVNQATFEATLNNLDVTGMFQVTGPNTRRAVFSLGSSPLQVGRNVLLTTVSGIVPGTNRTANDVDRVTFTVVP